MNWSKFKDPVSHMCLAGTVVASWSLAQGVTGSNPFTVIFLSLNLLNSMKTFRENSIIHPKRLRLLTNGPYVCAD